MKPNYKHLIRVIKKLVDNIIILRPPMTEEEMQRALFSEKEKKVIAYLREKFEEDLDRFESDHWLPEYDNIVY